MPELAAFEVLLAIARTGSLGAAGRELGLTQQAVSSRLASLESQTGVRLVQRSTRGSRLTRRVWWSRSGPTSCSMSPDASTPG